MLFRSPRSLAELAAARQANPQARLVAGATDLALGITKALRDPGDLLWLGAVPELQTIRRTADGGLTIGAAASLADAFAALVAFEPGWAELARRFAGPPVRHAGTLGGNIANGSPIGDSMPGLIALGARLVLRQGAQQRRLPLDEFYLGYGQTALAPGEFIEAVEVPPAPAGSLFRCWKVSKRHDQDISALCGAFALTLAAGRVGHARIAFGGMAATPARARATEAALVDQAWAETTLEAASAALATDFTPLTDLRASAAYRRQAAAGLLRRLWLETCGTAPLRLADIAPAAQAAPATATVGADRPPPIGQPLPHESAHLHVAGSATYTDDIPELRGTLYAALITSPVAHGELLGDHGLLEKSCMYEGCLRIPLLVHLPGMTQRRDSDALAELMDLAPTCLELAGADWNRREMDAVSLVPVLNGSTEPLRPVQRSELHNCTMLFDGRYKWIRSYNDTDELYDLETDPQELHNVINEHPEVLNRMRPYSFRH